MAGAGIIGLGIGLTALALAHVAARRGRRVIDDSPLGDVPFLHPEFGGNAGAARDSSGGGSKRTALGTQQDTFRTHVGSVSNR